MEVRSYHIIFYLEMHIIMKSVFENHILYFRYVCIYIPFMKDSKSRKVCYDVSLCVCFSCFLQRLHFIFL